MLHAALSLTNNYSARIDDSKALRFVHDQILSNNTYSAECILKKWSWHTVSPIPLINIQHKLIDFSAICQHTKLSCCYIFHLLILLPYKLHTSIFNLIVQKTELPHKHQESLELTFLSRLSQQLINCSHFHICVLHMTKKIVQ